MGEKKGSSFELHVAFPERDGPGVESDGCRLKRRGSWIALAPPQLVRRREMLSEERGVAGRELPSPAGVPDKSTAEDEEE